MLFRFCCRTVLFAAAALIVAGPATAQPRVVVSPRADYPHLRAALQELREARQDLQKARDVWPAGYRDRALRSIAEAIASVKTILAVKDVNTFRGVDRNPDYYKRYTDHPHLRSALEDLRQARQELRMARANVGSQRQQALDDIDVAIGDILVLIRHGRR